MVNIGVRFILRSCQKAARPAQKIQEMIFSARLSRRQRPRPWFFAAD